MDTQLFNNMQVNKEYKIITPEMLKKKFFLSEKENEFILENRHNISNIIHGKDSRFLVICGPCSIHNTDEALEYASRLARISLELQECLYIVMRVYFEKPRTITGWKGLINDPYMNQSYKIEDGLNISRKLLLQLNQMKLPLAMESLDVNIIHYISDLFSWSAIGARTTESQVHREIASGLLMPVGFKNGTDGNFIVAINAISSAKMQHNFLSLNQKGCISVIKTCGNADGHIILRGGKESNYHSENIISCEKQLISSGLPLAILVDCSHGNSNKNYNVQKNVVEEVTEQIEKGNKSIIGIMLESYIFSGNQEIDFFQKKLKYGISVTDGCISWEMTKDILYKLYDKLYTFCSSKVIK